MLATFYEFPAEFPTIFYHCLWVSHSSGFYCFAFWSPHWPDGIKFRASTLIEGQNVGEKFMSWDKLLLIGLPKNTCSDDGSPSCRAHDGAWQVRSKFFIFIQFYVHSPQTKKDNNLKLNFICASLLLSAIDFCCRHTQLPRSTGTWFLDGLKNNLSCSRWFLICLLCKYYSFLKIEFLSLQPIFWPKIPNAMAG